MSNTFLREKRIKNDIKHFITGGYDSHGIYIIINDSDITNVKCLIIGPDGTPYENGFHLFDVNFPVNYPYSPPTVKYISQPHVRVNPNLYSNGKVCLSMLNTWNGPSWEPTLSLSKILITIQSILNDNPLQNEPGFENVELNNNTNNNTKALNYRNIIKYFNIECSVLDIINKIPIGFEDFKETMDKYFIKNINKYKKYIETELNYDTPTIYSSVYNMQKKINITHLKNTLNSTYEKLLIQYPELSVTENNDISNNDVPDILADTQINGESSSISIAPIAKKKYIRQCPDELAKNFDVGYIQCSHNNKNYIVKEVSYKDKKIKRWCILK